MDARGYVPLPAPPRPLIISLLRCIVFTVTDTSDFIRRALPVTLLSGDDQHVTTSLKPTRAGNRNQNPSGTSSSTDNAHFHVITDHDFNINS